MAIAIVSTFVKPHIQETPADDTATAATTDVKDKDSANFASILLGLPVAAAKPLPEDDAPASSEQVIADAGTAVLAVDPQFLATLGLPPLQPPGNSEVAARREVGSPRPVGTAAVLTPMPADIGREALEINAQTGAGRQPSAPTALATADQAARFAVADFAANACERAGPSKPEPIVPVSSLSTLAALPGNNVDGVTQEPPRDLQTPLRDPSWASDLGQKLLWFANNDKQLAQMTLHPPQLGSLEVTLKMDKDSTSAHFVSLNAEVRGAIDSALPRLREMFANAGIALGQVSIGSESFGQQSEGRQEPSRSPRPLADHAILGSDSANGVPGRTFGTQRGHRLIDIFA